MKAYGKMQSCMDLARLNKVLIKLVHRDPRLNIILPKLAEVKYLTLFGVNLCNHKLKLDKQLSYLTTCPCLFDMYKYICLSF